MVRIDAGRLARTAVFRARRVARWAVDPMAVANRMRRRFNDVGAANDRWPECEVERTVVIASEVRTGSSMLCDLLESTGRCGAPQEYFSAHAFEGWATVRGVPVLAPSERIAALWRRVRLRRHWHRTWNYAPGEIQRYIDDVISARTSPNGVFAMNVHWHQWLRMRALGFDESVFPGEVTWVHLWRDDVVAQAVSALRAMQTYSWKSDEQHASRPEAPHYDEPELDRYVRQAISGREGWDRFFAERNLSPYRISYEQLVQDRLGVVAAVFDAAGIDAAALDGRPEASTSFQRQGNQLNVEWAARYRANHPDVDDRSRSGQSPG